MKKGRRLRLRPGQLDFSTSWSQHPIANVARRCFFMAKERGRNWAFIVYPESAPLDWIDVIREELVPGFVSPLHDKDENEDGETKKPHWHVLLMFNGNKSAEQVHEISEKVNGTIPVMVKDLRSYARYLCHLDDPNKAQYEPKDVVELCGTDYLEKMKSLKDTDSTLSEIMDWCIQERCYSFFRLVNHSREFEPEWFRVLNTSKTVFMVHWLKSLEWEVKAGNF